MTQFDIGYLRSKRLLICLGLGIAVMFSAHGAAAQQDTSPIASNLKSGDVISLQSSTSASEMASIPVAPCQENPPMGDSVPPQSHPINVSISPAISSEVELYFGSSLVVLAPKGWTCSETIGADALDLLVMPPNGHGLLGPAVYIESSPEDPNGWAMIAAYGGTYFPKLITSAAVDDAVENLKQQGSNVTKKQLLIPRYPDDQLTYVNDSILEYQTPAQKMGLGTVIGSGLPFTFPPDLAETFSDLPTYGVIGLIGNPASGQMVLNLLAVRLPPKFAILHEVIQHFTVNCQPFDPKATCFKQINFVNDGQ